MVINQETKEFWDKEIINVNLIWPNEHIIRFVKRNFHDRNSVILDFGCGAGRNAIALAMEGYNIIAMDHSEEAVELAREKSLERLLDIEFLVNKNTDIPLKTASVNAIVANGSLFYNDWNTTIKLLSNLHDVLSENGLMWADWRTKEDSLYAMGEETEKDFFKMNEESGRKGCYYHFFDEQQLRELYTKAGFQNVSIDRYMYTENDGSKRNAWWHVVAQK